MTSGYLWQQLNPIVSARCYNQCTHAQQPVDPVPYFCQLQMDDGQGWRDCFSASGAMLAGWAGKVSGENQYNHVRQKHGDSTNPAAQVAALSELGLKASFSTNGNKAKLVELLNRGTPVAVGILHHGQVAHPSGGGHWMVAIGATDTHVICHDPYGDLGLVAGEWEKVGGDAGKAIHYSWKNWLPRWEVAGGDGYMLWVERGG